MRVNKKILLVSFPLFFISLILYLLVFQKEFLVSLGFRMFTYGDLKIENLVIEEGSTLKKGEIELLNSKLIDRNKNIAGKLPRAILSYENYQIKSIDIYSPEVNFVRNKKDMNLVRIFTNGQKKQNSNSKKETSLNKVLLRKINVYNGNLLYEDISYSEKISKKIVDVNGYVEFLKNYKIDLEFNGQGKELEKEKLGIKWTNINGYSDFDLNLKDIEMTDNLFLYAYDNHGKIKNVSGLANLNLKFAKGKIIGQGHLKNGQARYEDLDEDIKNINLDLDFNQEGIYIDGDYDLGKNKGYFDLDYSKTKGLIIGFLLDNILYEDARKYKYLENIDLGIKDLIVDKVDVWLKYINKKFSVEVDFQSFDGGYKDKLKLSGVDGKFKFIPKEGFFLEDLKAKLKFKNTEITTLNNFKYYQKEGEITSAITKIGSEKIDEILLKANFNHLEEEKLDIDFQSDFINIGIIYDFNKKILELSQGEDSQVVYNTTKKEIEDLKGEFKGKIQDQEIKFTGNLSKDKEKILNLNGEIIKEDKKIGRLDFIKNFNSSSYEGEIDLKDISLNLNSLSTVVDLQGKIKGNEDKYLGYLDINNLDLENIKDEIKLQGIEGRLEFYKDEENQNLSFKDKHLNLDLNYNLNTSNLDSKIKISNLTEDNLKIKNFKYRIKNLEGNLKGEVTKTLDKLLGSFRIEGESFGDKLDFSGKINYNKNDIIIKDFNINKSKLNLNYNIVKKLGNYNLIIDESLPINLGYFLEETLVRGKTFGEINKEKIKGEYLLEINNAKYENMNLPRLKSKGRYTEKLINIDYLAFVKNGEKTAESKGYVDFSKKEMKLEANDTYIDIEDFFPNKNLSGRIKINGYLRGKNNKLEYNLISLPSLVYYDEEEKGRLDFKISGDETKINLDYLNMIHTKNNTTTKGSYNFKEKKHNFKLKSDFSDIVFLKEFSEYYKIENIKGRGRVDLEYKDSKLSGDLDIQEFELDIPTLGLYLEETESSISIDKNIVKISKFLGKINKGKIDIKGSLALEDKYSDKLVLNNLERLRYKLNIKTKEIDYQYKDYGRLNVTSNLYLANEMIKGFVTINDGKITKIQEKEVRKGFVEKIRSYLNKKSFEKSMPVDLRLGFIENKTIDVRVLIDKGIELDIKDTNGNFKNIKGSLGGQGKIQENDGTLDFLGEINIKEGRFDYNNREFIIDTGVVVFDRKSQGLSILNPEILFETSTNINDKDYVLTLRGPFDNLEVYIKSGNEVSYSSLDSILYSDNSDTQAGLFIAELIGGEITNVIVSPFAEILRKYFGLSNLRVSSNIISGERKLYRDGDIGLAFGGYIQVENPLYKDSVYLKIRVNFLDTSSEEDYIRTRKNIIDYDVGVYEKINKEFSWGVGVQKIKDDYKLTEEEKNYYVEIKFEKLFNF